MIKKAGGRGSWKSITIIICVDLKKIIETSYALSEHKNK